MAHNTLKTLFTSPSWYDTKANIIVIDTEHPLTKKHRQFLLQHELIHYSINQHKPVKLISKIPLFQYIFFYLIEEPYVILKQLKKEVTT